MISLAGLNPQQRIAAEQIEGPVLILAGAGSGKTRTLTYRIAHMVDNLGISSRKILGVSFTNKAAKEMRERAIGLLGKTKARGLSLTTFHSLGVRILRKEIENLGYHKNFSIYDTSDQLAIIREALKNYKADKKFDHKQVISKIGYLKNNAITCDEYKDTSFFDPADPYDIATEYCYHYYQDKLKFYNAIDFDDILFLTVKLFKEFPEIAKKYSENFHYIMIDEYQDTNTLQYELTMGLTSTHNNLCVVGDDDQSIYSFRGADISNILNFEKDFPDAKVIKLEQNYRSTSPILNLANKVIGENKERREKTLWSTKDSEHVPLLWSMADTDHEAEIVVEDVLQHQKEGKHLGDIAILYRSNTQAPPIEEHLRMSSIPYTVYGGQKFYEKKEVKDLMAYLCVINNTLDQLSLRRILNIPNRGIGTKTLEKFLSKMSELESDLFHAMTEHPELAEKRESHIKNFVELIGKYKDLFTRVPLQEALSVLIEELNYLQFIEKNHDNPKQIERRKNDVMAFIDSAERFQNFYGAEKRCLRQFVEKVLLQDSQDNNDDEDEDDDIRKNEVTLMTLHSSKGLEFKKVYLLGVEEETLPHKKTITLGEGVSEERRLCYVGITRAQEKLIMTYCKERKIYGKNIPRNMSRFLNDHKDYFLEQDRTTFGHLTPEEADQYKKDFFANLIDDL